MTTGHLLRILFKFDWVQLEWKYSRKHRIIIYAEMLIARIQDNIQQ